MKWLMIIILICTFVFVGIFADDVVYQNNSEISGNLTTYHEFETVTDINGNMIKCVKHELIIQFRPEITKDHISYESISNTTHLGINGTIIQDYGFIGMPGVQLIKLPENISVEQGIQYYLSCPSILYAEPNDIIEIAPSPVTSETWNSQGESSGDILKGIPNDPEFPQQWGLRMVNVQNVWDYTTGSDNVIIAIIDSGVDYNHIDLKENLWRNTKEIPNNGFDDDGNGYIDDYIGWNFVSKNNNPKDDYGHGTHCAGIIAARGNNKIGVTGTVWNVKIMPLKVNEGDKFLGASILEAIQYAKLMNADIISCSFSSSSSNIIEQNSYRNSNALIICAAGNEMQNIDLIPHYPSSYHLNNIISVAATDRYDKLASFSNYGVNTVDIGAPGVEILSTIPNNQYDFNSGTSMATPLVAGVAGLIKSKHPDLTNEQIKAAILNNVDTVVYLNGKVTSGGRLNAYKALHSLEQSAAINIQSNPTGAKIYLDNINTGYITPKTISNLAAGSHVLHLSLNGYNETTIPISVISGEITNVSVNLVSSASSIALAEGWNFVSTPKILAPGSNTAMIFSKVNMGGHSVFMWDGSQNPPCWVNVHANTPIQPLYGFWIYSVSEDVVNLTFDTTNPRVVPAPRSLSEGWNAIGFTGLNPTPACNTYISVQPNWVHSIEFNSITQRYCPTIFNGDTSESTILYPTKGYWLYMRTPGNLAAIGA